jgi:hypothetical protein
LVYDVGNQQKWDTFVKERSGGNGRVLGLPKQALSLCRRRENG